MNLPTIEEIEENLQELQIRNNSLFNNLSVRVVGLDKNGFLKQNLEQVDIIDYVRIQEELEEAGCRGKAYENSKRLVNIFLGFKEALKNNFEKEILLLNQMKTILMQSEKKQETTKRKPASPNDPKQKAKSGKVTKKKSAKKKDPKDEIEESPPEELENPPEQSEEEKEFDEFEDPEEKD